MDSSISSAWNVSGFQTVSFGMLRGWSAFCSADTIRTSKAMNRLNYEASQIGLQSCSPIFWMRARFSGSIRLASRITQRSPFV